MKSSDEIKLEYGMGERLELEKYILVFIFLIQQRWDYIINKEFIKNQITTKQWLFLVILSNAFTQPPSMQEMATAMSTSHQNVKQLAIRLENKEMIKIERDPTNKRILCLKTTEKHDEFWKKRDDTDVEFIKKLFNDLDYGQLKDLFCF